jgi:hypothetical protein
LDKPLKEDEDDMATKLTNLFFFASIWTIGATVDFDGRIKME